MTTKKTEAPEQAIGPTPMARLEAQINHVVGLHRLPTVTARYDQRLIAIAATQFELGLLALAQARRLAGDDLPEDQSNG